MKKIIQFLLVILIVTISFAQKKPSKSVASQKSRIVNCLCSNTYTQFGTYTFYKNGTFDYEQPRPYPLFKTGTWSYVSGNKVKINKTWLGKSQVVSVDSDCNLDWGG